MVVGGESLQITRVIAVRTQRPIPKNGTSVRQVVHAEAVVRRLIVLIVIVSFVAGCSDGDETREAVHDHRQVATSFEESFPNLRSDESARVVDREGNDDQPENADALRVRKQLR